MKKLLLTTAILLITIMSVQAQCTPDPQFTNAGIFPDSATGLNSGCEGVYYEQIITAVVPVDTTVDNPLGPPFPPITLAFDSIVVTGFTGLPASGNLTYACWSTLGGCSFPGGGSGCMIISGTPSAADIGTHMLTITVDAYLGGLSTPSSTQVIDWYYIDIVSAANCSNGIDEHSNQTVQVYPNPTYNKVNIDNLPSDAELLSIMNLEGKEVYSNKVTNGFMSVDMSKFDNGVYFIRIEGAKSNEVIKLIKE